MPEGVKTGACLSFILIAALRDCCICCFPNSSGYARAVETMDWEARCAENIYNNCCIEYVFFVFGLCQRRPLTQ